MIKPINKTVMVIPSVQQKTTSHGLTIAVENNQNTIQSGEVVSTVESYFNEHDHKIDTPFKPGDYVLYSKHVANSYYVNGVHYHLVNIEDILAMDTPPEVKE